MKNVFFLTLFCFLVLVRGTAQKALADSLSKAITHERTDTGRVKLMWKLAGAINLYDPVKAIEISNKALVESYRIKYLEGQAKSLGALVQALVKIGNYPLALEYNFRKLQLEEKRNKPVSYASTLIAIGNVYNFQEDYEQAKVYYYKSDSVNKLFNLEENKYYTWFNLGDLYNKTGLLDSAFYFYNRSLERANELKNDDFVGASLTGLGHIYLKKGDFALSLANYHSAMENLKKANDDEMLCEASMGLARLFRKMNLKDSARYFSSLAFSVAEKDSFPAWELESTKFLSEHFREDHNTDSAYLYLAKVQRLNDTLNSKRRIRESQLLSSNEQLRQVEAEEARKAAQKERQQQLQYLFIGIFIPGLFLFTLLLSSIRIHIRVIRVLGVISLLVFFEYLTLLLHPYVANLTHHTPVYEMLIFVSVAALLIPAHHRFEHWLITKLTHHKDRSIRLKKVKMTLKGPSGTGDEEL